MNRVQSCHAVINTEEDSNVAVKFGRIRPVAVVRSMGVIVVRVVSIMRVSFIMRVAVAVSMFFAFGMGVTCVTILFVRVICVAFLVRMISMFFGCVFFRCVSFDHYFPVSYTHLTLPTICSV